MAWESAERVQKNDQGQYRALINGEWVPVTRAQKNESGQYRVERIPSDRGIPSAQKVISEPAEIPMRRVSLADIGDRATGFRPQVEATGMTPQERAEAVRGLIPIAASFGAGPVLAAALRTGAAAVPALQTTARVLAPALESGGFRTGLAPTATALQRVGVRATGGAITGGVSTGMIAPEETSTGATVGGTLAAIAPPAVSGTAKTIGWAADLVSRRLPKTKANKLISETVRGEIDQVRNAMLADPTALPSRVAADLNYPTLSALLKKYEEKDLADTAYLLRTGETDKFVNEMAALAGGRTATEARVARGVAKKELTEETSKIREEAFEKARQTGNVVPLLDVIRTTAREASSAAVEEVRRYAGLISKAEDWAKNWVRESRLVEGPDGKFTREYGRGIGEAGVRPPTATTFPGQIAAKIPQRMDEAAAASRDAGMRARIAENLQQSIAARGLSPISGPQLIASLRRRLADPSVAENKQAKAGVTAVIRALERWQNDFGVVSPEAIDAIRKNAVNDAIRRIMRGADERAVAQRASSVMQDINPLLDDAMVKAGGTRWPEYLRTYRQGMEEIKRMAFFDEIRYLAEKGDPASRRKIVKVLSGEDPDFVEKAFGTGKFDIAEMTPKARKVLDDMMSGLRKDIAAEEKAALGAEKLKMAEEKSASWRIRFPFLSNLSTIGNATTQAMDEVLSNKTRDALIVGARSGEEFAKLLDAVPTKERNAVLRIFRNPQQWNKYVGQVAQAAQAQVTAGQRNALAPENQNAMRQ